MVKLNDIFDEFADEFETPPGVPAPVKWEEEELLKSLKQSVDGLAARVEGRRKTRDWMTSYLTKIIKKEIDKLPPQQVIERQVEQIIKHEQVPVHLEPRVVESPPQIIRETRVEVQVPDKNDYAQNKTVDELKEKISEMEKELERVRLQSESQIIFGGPGVIGIPPPESSIEGYVLTVDSNKKASWKSSSVTSSGVNIGDPTVDGSWRIVQSGTELSIQKLESSIWVEKGVFTA